MASSIYCGKVADEPETWVVGELKRVEDNYAVIYQKQELPFAKCCGVGDFVVDKNSLILISEPEVVYLKTEGENAILKQEIKQLEEQCEKLIEKRDNLTIQKDKELAIYKKALELSVKRVNKTMEEPNRAIEKFVILAKTELETKNSI